MSQSRLLRMLGLALALGAVPACESTPPVTPTDGGTDAGPPTTIDEIPVSETLELPGLDGEVEVVYDDRGIPHIYGSTLHDVLVVEGYLMCVDRFAQMEFIRRNVLGRLAEVAGNVSPGLIDSDIEAREIGYGRMGREIYQSLQTSTDPLDVRAREAAEAFVAGINIYIARVRERDERVRPWVEGAEALNFITGSPYFDDWAPADVFAMARFQAASLSYDAGADVYRTRALAGVQRAFPPGSADAALAARAGAFVDLFSDFPARPVYTRAGFPNDPTDTGSRAFLPDLARPRRAGLPMRMPSPSVLAGAAAFFGRMDRRFAELGLGDEHRGSNNWVVGAELTATGHPILANDPHLSLISPPIWWYVHLNTARAGGEDMIDAEGIAFAGLPGVVLGFNRHIAWGATTTGYDVTDVYLETITEGTPDTVRFDGAEVPIEIVREEIRIAEMAMPRILEIEVVPHHGRIIADSRVDLGGGRAEALSVRYTGDEPSNELAFFTGLLTATTVEEARTAQDHFRVGAQNFVVVDQDSIAWSTESRIPVRDPRAMDFAIADDGTVSGHSPLFVLPGTGEYEWVGDLDPRYIPHDQDPTRGWIATANQDNVGVTDDGNPCDDGHYVGGGFDYGQREHRIQERLTALATRGDITVEDMITLQATTTSSLGEGMRDALVAILESPASTIPTLSTEEQTRLADVRARLIAWSLETPHGVGATDAEEIADSVATTIFNVSITRIIPLALEDEVQAMEAMGGVRPGSAELARFVEWAIARPEALRTVPDGETQSILWDDMRTTDVEETREERVIRGVLVALSWLDMRLGTTVDEWRWGRLHAVRFNSVVPPVDPSLDYITIPRRDDPMYPIGFPRHGDWGAVDVGNFGLWGSESFTHGSGASQRLVVEMTPNGPLAYNALPGGQSIDHTSVHHDDEAALWIANEQPRVSFTEAEVVEHHERRVSVRSGP